MAPSLPAPATDAAAAEPTQAQSANQTAAISQVLKDIFHLEVAPTSETRDLLIKRAAAGTVNSNSGFLQLEGTDKQIPVLYQGQIHYLPAKLVLQAGKYEVKSIQDGKIVGTQEIEIQAGMPQKVLVKR
jgi:hypothetical protein